MVTNLVTALGWDMPWQAGTRLYWPFLASALVIGLVYQRWFGLANFFTRGIWWSPSARQDYAMFSVLNVFKISLLALLVPELGQFIWWWLSLLPDWLGYQEKKPTSVWVSGHFSLCLFIANDFSRYALHRAMHEVSWLWPIHRLHHSATVLTPVTFYRIHPVESLLYGLRYGIITGLVSSIYLHWFGFGLQAQQWLGSLSIVALANLLGSNLRHSHIPLSYPRAIQTWFISPAQHQWHHSKHGNKNNYGSIFACWDRLFGSLHNSNRQHKFDFGTHDTKANQPIWRQLLLPYQKIATKRDDPP